MKETKVREMYAEHYGGDRERRDLFAAFADWFRPSRVLYPGSFVHVAASFEFPMVAYVDTDRRAGRFFAARDAVLALIASQKAYPQPAEIEFLGGGYEQALELPDAGFDLLISLYAGFISKPCKRYLRVGGCLLVNNSHADAGLAALDPDYVLAGVVLGRGDRLRVSEASLDEYLVPKKGAPVTEVYLRQHRRGVAYTRPAAAYVFRRVA